MFVYPIFRNDRELPVQISAEDLRARVLGASKPVKLP